MINDKDKMKQITVYTHEENYLEFVSLLQNLRYVKKIETLEIPTKEAVLHGIKQGINDVNLFKQGKLNTTLAKDFLSEL